MDHGGVVVPATMDVQVLVHPEAPEVEGLTVDEESRPLDPHRADADRQGVAVDDHAVVGQFDVQLVEVPLSGLPQLRLRHAQLAGGAGSLGDSGAAGIAEPYPDRRPSGVLHDRGVPDHRGPLVDVGDHCHIGDVGARCREQPHTTVQPCVVEEVVILPLTPGAVRQYLNQARRQGLPCQLVVDHDGEAELLAGLDQGGDVSLEGCVPALVLGNTGVRDPDRGPVRRRVESQDDPLAGPAAGDEDRALVPDVTDVVMHPRVRQHVVEAARDRHPQGAGQPRPPPALCTAGAGGVEREAPDAVEPFGLPGAVVLRPKH